ncbi:MAG: hypothetical protein ACXVXN_08625 [Mycobacteriaceae bacterium]
MRMLRGLAGSLLWIVACLVGLVGALLSVTLILAPVGVPLLFLARRLFQSSMALFLPRAVRHPAQELRRKGHDAVAQAGKQVRRKTGRRRLWGRRSRLDRLVEWLLQGI